MPIVICAGGSVNDYDRMHLENLARLGFTFAVNHTCFDFPCDVVVSLDPDFVTQNKAKLIELGKPIVARKYPCLVELADKLDFIFLPFETIEKYPYSGMVAAKLSDSLTLGGRPSYIIGLDGTTGRYKGHKGDGAVNNYEKPGTDYEAMRLSNTINLSVHSKVKCWPKASKLPKIERIITTAYNREFSLLWLRKYAVECL